MKVFSTYADKNKRKILIKIWIARLLYIAIGMIVMFAATKGKGEFDESKRSEIKTDFKNGIKGN